MDSDGEVRAAGSKRKAPKCKAPTKRARKDDSDKRKEKPKPTKAKKPPKAKVDKSNPNWRLKANPRAPNWEVDPLFESDQPLPFVSSLSHSRLVIRAVLTGDQKLLQKCIDNKAEVFSRHAKRSLSNNMTALRYAIKSGNMATVKQLTKKEQ